MQYNTLHIYVYVYIYINTVYVLYLGILFSLEFDDPIGPSNILGSASTAWREASSQFIFFCKWIPDLR